MSCVHNWNDTRIFYKEAYSLSKVFKVELHALADFKEKDVNGISVKGLPKYISRKKRPLNWFRLLYRAFKSDAKVFHFHDPELIPVGLILKLFRKGKVIYDIHEDYPESMLNKFWIPENRRIFISKAFNRFEKWSSTKFDANINVLEHINNKFKRKKVVTEIIKNYPLLSELNRKNELFKEKTTKVVYIGGLAELRGIYEIIDSLDYIKSQSVTLTLAGTYLRKEVDDRIRLKAEKDSRLRYLGKVPYEEVFNILNASDIALVCFKPGPNHDYCLPNKLFEYMSTGLPIVATATPYWVETFSKYRCVEFISEVTPQLIGEAIEKLIFDKEETVKMGQRGYEAYVENFIWNSEEKKLLSLYEALIK
jgi:glycosyltransferase involved in cell wall biosynthesis